MPLNYDDAKKYFADKIGADWFGKGRMESAFFHTAQWIYDQGHVDGVNDSNTPCIPVGPIINLNDWSHYTVQIEPLARRLSEAMSRREWYDAAVAAQQLEDVLAYVRTIATNKEMGK